MAGPWEKYAAQEAPAAGPWLKYGAPPDEAPAQAAAPKAAVSNMQHMSDVLGIFKNHPFSASVGLGENALSGVTAGAGSLAEALTGADPGTHDWGYRPRTEAGQQIANAGAVESGAIGRRYDTVAGTGPLAQTLKERLPQAAGAVGTVTAAAALPKFGAGLRVPAAPALTAEDVVSQLGAQQSTSAAAAAPSLINVSPELRSAITTTARKTGGAINPEVLARHVDADTVFRGTKARLTEGQATGDPRLISNEQNMRGKEPQYAENFDAQNKALASRLQTIRDEAGPEVFSANHVEHGDTLIAAYKAKDAAAETAINSAYQALRDANGGQFPVSAKKLLESASKDLHDKLLFDHAPKEVMSTLDRLVDSGAMTFENFESLRTNLARIQRTSQDGNAVAAAGVIRNAMEKLPLDSGAAGLKPLADKARSLAKAQFDAVGADPAYAAAVKDTVAPDHFVNKYVLRGTRDDLARMVDTIGDDASAAQTISVAALDHLREQARLSPHYEGNFATAGFNKALTKLAPNLQSLLSAQTVEQLEQLGRVARYTTDQPRGSYVNNSNTFVAGAAESAKGALEGGANFAAMGIPVGTWVRKGVEGARSKKQAGRSMAPGAGLDRLPEPEPPPKPRGLMQ